MLPMGLLRLSAVVKHASGRRGLSARLSVVQSA
jgi:hypothetical protein